MNIKNTPETRLAQALAQALNTKSDGHPGNLTEVEWELVRACDAFLVENSE